MKKTFIKEYSNWLVAKSVFERYRLLYSSCKLSTKFKIISPIALDKNKIEFNYIDIHYSFAQKYKYWDIDANDFYKLWSILAEFHQRVNWNFFESDCWILHGDFWWWNVVIDDNNIWWLIDCEVPLDWSGREFWNYYEDIVKTLIFLRSGKSIINLFSFDLPYENAYLHWYEEILWDRISLFILEKYYILLMLRSIKVYLRDKYYLAAMTRIVFLLFHTLFYFIYNNVFRRFRTGN